MRRDRRGHLCLEASRRRKHLNKEGADKGDFATCVYYLKNKYRVIATDPFRMSTTPQTPSKYNDTVDKRSTCTWVILENIETGFCYVHMNCHLDWKTPTANTVQTEMIRNMMLRFDALGYPVFTTGDFNTTEEGAKYLCIGADSNKSGDGEFAAECTIYHVAIYSQSLGAGEVFYLYQNC